MGDCVSKKSNSSPGGASKLSLASLSLNIKNCSSAYAQATASNPKDDLKKGFFDVAIRLPGKSGAVDDPIVDTEDRIDTFLED